MSSKNRQKKIYLSIKNEISHISDFNLYKKEIINKINNAHEDFNLSKGQIKRDRVNLKQLFSEDQLFKELFIKNYNLSNKYSQEEIKKFLLKKSIFLQELNNKLDITKELKSFNVKLKKENRKKEIKDLIKNELDTFYMKNKESRKIIFHVGETNSGKSYNALQSFRNSKSACYLAPLRLLAWEVFDKYKDELEISLITGEEKNTKKSDTHFSSTIEMANLSKNFDVCVIDEIQMISDKDRGWFWTKSLCLINAKEIHLCGDESVLDLIKSISSLLGDSLEIKRHYRKTKLSFMNKNISLRNLEKGDALITFSRNNIFYYKKILEQEYNKKVSVIYGMLPPEIRKIEAKKFFEGETDIVIATDAIGMGMNLPIRRIIFSSLEKYYNKRSHPLLISEIKQIAGRAGRYKIEKEGFVGLLDQFQTKMSNFKDFEFVENKNKEFKSKLKNALASKVPKNNFAYVGIDLDHFKNINFKLKDKLSFLEYLYFFNQIKYSNKFFINHNIENHISQTEIVNSKLTEYKIEDFYSFSVAPLNLNNYDLIDYFEDLLEHYNTESTKTLNLQYIYLADLEDAELSLKKVDLYKWLKNQLDLNSTFLESDENIEASKNYINNYIKKHL